MERRNAWHEYTEAQLLGVESLATKYREFLDNGKTERECVEKFVAREKYGG